MKLSDMPPQSAQSSRTPLPIPISPASPASSTLSPGTAHLRQPIKKYAAAAKTTRASAVIVNENFPAISTGMLRTKNPYYAWAKAVELFYQPPRYAPGVHPPPSFIPRRRSANMRTSALTLSSTKCRHRRQRHPARPRHHLSRSKDRRQFLRAHPRRSARVLPLGNNVVLQNAVIVGSDGFGFAKDEPGGENKKAHWHKIVQSGNVVIGDDVEIQAGSCIDRAAVGQTRIARGAKIDNLVQVGHASTVGEDTLLCAQVGLAGSTEVGNNVNLAGQVGVAGHCKIGDGAIATAQSGIPNDVEPGKTVSGYPASTTGFGCAAAPSLTNCPS